MKSMTAFSRVEHTHEQLSVETEIRSYNSRYLDITPRIPQEYLPLEDRIRGLISEKVARGRVELKLRISDDSEEACAFEINEARATAYHDALVRLQKIFDDMEGKIPLDLLARVGGVIRPAEPDRDMEACWPPIAACVTEALNNLDKMRKTEGDFIAKDFTARLDAIENWLCQIEKASDGLLLYYQERLKERVAALTKGMTEIDPGRIAQEAAFLADKSDISEEIIRVRSHIGQFHTIMASEESGGRKLNFLLQEFNREFNTMGSKTGNANVSHLVVTVKSELEKIREQVQNME